jgi:hypothetical protein
MNKTLLALIVVFITATSLYSQPPKKNSWNKNRKKPTKKIKEFIPKEGKGYMLVSAYHKKEKIHASSYLRYKKILNKNKGRGEIIEEGVELMYRNSKINRHNIDKETSLYVLELDTGLYEFYSWKLKSSDIIHYLTLPTSYKFEIKANTINYVGNIHFHLTDIRKYRGKKGKKFAKGGFAEILDKYERDTSFFRLKFNHFEEMKIIKNDIKRNEFQYQSKKESIGYNYKFESDSIGILAGTIIQDFEAGFSTFMYFNGLESDVISCSGFNDDQLNYIKENNDTIPEFNKKYFFIELPLGEYTIDEFRVADKFDINLFDKGHGVNLYKPNLTDIKFTIKPKVINYLGEIKTEAIEIDKKITDINLTFIDKFEEMDSLLNENSISKTNIIKNEREFENTEKVIFHKIEWKN